MRIRHPAVAGTFYPDQPQQLQTEVSALLQQAVTPVVDTDRKLKALIVPHAGYIYSGAIAASAYNLLSKKRDKFTRVVLLGPSHRVALRGMAAPGAEVFATPMGDIQLDTDAIDRLTRAKLIQILPEAHAWEHSLEVQLPFLQSILEDFVLLPLVVGNTEAAGVADVLQDFWDDENTLIVISSDLSHYLAYPEAQRQDAETSRLIENRFHHLHGEQACGCHPLNGLLKLAADRDAAVVTLDQRNSGDTAGSRDRVVGYGAYAVYQ